MDRLLFAAHLAANAALRPGLRARAGNVWCSLRRRRELAEACALVPALMATLESQLGSPPPGAWRVQRATWTEGDMTVITVALPGQPPAAVLKLPYSAAGAASLRRQHAVLTRLRAEPALGPWRALLPTVLCAGTVEGRFITVEDALPGRAMRDSLTGASAQVGAPISLALSAIAELHRRTARTVVVDAGLLDRWIDTPLRSLAPIVHDGGALARLARDLHSALAGQTVSVGWIHGDFWPGNLLVAPDGATVTGIVDWDLAAPDELPVHDLLNFMLSTERLLHGRELGDAVRMRLNGGGWTERERTLLADWTPLPFRDATWARAMVLLYWLRYVATYLANKPHRTRDPWWLAKNVEGVLRSL